MDLSKRGYRRVETDNLGASSPQSVIPSQQALLHKIRQSLLLSNAYRDTVLMQDKAIVPNNALPLNVQADKKSLVDSALEIFFGKDSHVCFNRGSRKLADKAQQLEWLALGHFTIYEREIEQKKRKIRVGDGMVSHSTVSEGSDDGSADEDEERDIELIAAKKLCDYLYGTDDIVTIVNYHIALLYLQGKRYGEGELQTFNNDLKTSLAQLPRAIVNNNLEQIYGCIDNGQDIEIEISEKERGARRVSMMTVPLGDDAEENLMPQQSVFWQRYQSLRTTNGDFESVDQFKPLANRESLYSLLYDIKNVNRVERFFGKNKESRLVDAVMQIMGFVPDKSHVNEFQPVLDAVKPAQSSSYLSPMKSLAQQIRQLMIHVLFRYFDEYCVEISKRSQRFFFSISEPKREVKGELEAAKNSLLESVNGGNSAKPTVERKKEKEKEEKEEEIDDQDDHVQLDNVKRPDSTLELVSEYCQSALQPLAKVCNGRYNPMRQGVFGKKLEQHEKAFGAISARARLGEDVVTLQTQRNSGARRVR